MAAAIRTRIVKIGNSQGICLPKPLLEQSSIYTEVESEVQGDHLIVRAASQSGVGWDEAFAATAKRQDDVLLDDANTTKRLESIGFEGTLDVLQTSDPEFFQEWQDVREEISTAEVQRLGQVKSNFSYLLRKPPFLEAAVKTVVLSPLLELAGFYQQPFWIRTEAGTEISSIDEDEGTVIRGEIDVLVVSEKLWVLVIESKMGNFSLTAALPQTLSYMLASPQSKCFGMIANGSDFVFLKLNWEDTPTYSTSRVFSLLAPGNELVNVLCVLRHLGQTAINTSL